MYIKKLVRYIKSKSVPGRKYQVQENVKGKLTCTCIGYRYGRKCWHRNLVLETRDGIQSKLVEVM